MAPHKETNDANGMVALSICESLLLALTDLKVIRGQDVHDLLMDVVAVHAEAAADSPTPEKHRAVMEIIQRMLVGKNWDGQRTGSRSGSTVGAQSVHASTVPIGVNRDGKPKRRAPARGGETDALA